MKNLNACISYVSSRSKCIGHSLKSLQDNFNYRYDYPVYVHYFDDIYSDDQFSRKIKEEINTNIEFIPIDYKTPDHIKREELFFNRDYLWYVRSSFSWHRMGYLHMCHFVSNMFNYPGTKLDKHDYIMVHDDEAGYDSELPYNPFEVMSKRDELLGCFKSGQRLKDGKPHQDWCDTYVLKTKMFETDLWKLWIKEINEFGGIYKYRWGDNEVISLFAHFIQEEIYDFKAVEKGYHNLGKYRLVQDIAPSIKNPSK